MISTYQKMERCSQFAQSDDCNIDGLLIELLSEGDWRVRYAAAVACGDRRAEVFVAPLLRVLAAEDAAPLYSQPEVEAGGHAGATEVLLPQFPGGTTPEEIEAWKRRGRLKQAACLALGQIGKVDARVLDVLHRYATDAREDYTVRAAACKALGEIGSTRSAPFLERATRDEEWCTATEAAKSLAKINA
jgi:HEAT repeat protein